MSSISDSITWRPEPSSSKRRNTAAIADRTASSGIEDDAILLVIDEPDRQSLTELSLGRLVAEPRGQPVADQVQLGLGHGALQAEHQPVVEVGGVIEAVAVGDERVGHRAQVEQLIPVGVVAGEARHLDPQDDADLPEADVGDEVLEALPSARLGTRTAEIVIDDDHLARRPSENLGTRRKLVLALEALGVLAHLCEGRLADVDVSVPIEVRGRDLRGQLSCDRHLAATSSSVSTTPMRDHPGEDPDHGSWLGSGSDHHRSSGSRAQLGKAQGSAGRARLS